MKKQIAKGIQLSGTVQGIKFKIGVPNPYSGRFPPLGPRHLRALRALVTLVELDQMQESFFLGEREFAQHFPLEGGVNCLKDVLICWLKTRSKEVEVFSTFADVTFYEKRSVRSMRIRLSETTFDLLRKMLTNSGERQ